MTRPSETSHFRLTNRKVIILGIAAIATLTLIQIADYFESESKRLALEESHKSLHSHNKSTISNITLDHDLEVSDAFRYIHDNDITPSFTSILTDAKIFNISRIREFSESSSTPKLATMFVEQWDKNFVRNEGEMAGVENVQQLYDLRRMAVKRSAELRKATTEGKDPIELTRQILRDEMLVQMAMTHCWRGIDEMKLYPDLPKLEDIEGDFYKMIEQEKLLKNHTGFMNDIDAISKTISDEVLEKLSKALIDFDLDKEMSELRTKHKAAPDGKKGLRAVTAKDLFGKEAIKSHDAEVRHLQEKNLRGKSGKSHGKW